ncbi:hypothetical protein HD806DRAFT_536196 [Xylariaceae sp. AK1471]|nr:hypothetical protein HD806DRAFT_536196 [Xylariaceae sp. AK1471]
MRFVTLLHALALLSEAVATGGYTDKCKAIALWTGVSKQDGWQIIADCPPDRPNDIVPWVCSTLALDLCYANYNGVLTPAEK